MTTRFRLNLPGFTVELEGQRTFVEDLYRTISRDLEPMLKAASSGQPITLPELSPESEGTVSTNRRSSHIWVYFCTTLFNKVYVMENNTVEATLLGRFIDVDRIRRIYIDDIPKNSSVFSNNFHNNRTLWAEFTDEGRELLRNTIAQQNKDGSG